MSVKTLLIFALPLLANCAPPIQPDPTPLPPRQEVTAQQWAAGCKDWDEWDKPAPPYRIHGSTYYVGTCGISAILIAGSAGHILIDSGTEAGAKVVMENIGKLGFRLNDIALILHSHEHFDHVGGLSLIQQASGAHIAASRPASEVLRTGKAGQDDPQFGMHPPMKPVSVDVLVDDGQELRTESTVVTAIATPGHTPGALSWTWRSCDENGDCKQITYADSMSPVSSDSYRFTDHPAYLAAFREGIARLGSKPCDILLTPHPSASEMVKRATAGSLVGGMSCSEYSANIRSRLDARLAEEAAGG